MTKSSSEKEKVKICKKKSEPALLPRQRLAPSGEPDCARRMKKIPSCITMTCTRRADTDLSVGNTEAEFIRHTAKKDEI